MGATSLSEWVLSDLQGSELLVTDALFDWRANEALKYFAGPVDYQTRFEHRRGDERTVLDLGLVQGAAEVFVIGQDLARLAYHPFSVDLTDHLVLGENVLTIRLYPPQRNEFIGRAIDGQERYSNFEGRESETVASGLIGPVSIKKSVGSIEMAP